MSDMRQVLPGAPTAQWTPWGSYQDILVDRCADGLALSLIHVSEPTRPERISYAVFCLKK